MTKLSTLLHDVVDVIWPNGNRNAELHAAVDDAIAELSPGAAETAADAPAEDPAPVLNVPAKGSRGNGAA